MYTQTPDLFDLCAGAPSTYGEILNVSSTIKNAPSLLYPTNWDFEFAIGLNTTFQETVTAINAKSYSLEEGGDGTNCTTFTQVETVPFGVNLGSSGDFDG